MRPQIRFKEFTDEWEEKKLGDFMNFANGINTDKNNYGTGRKMISVLDVLNDSKLLSKNIINSVNISKEMEEKYKVTYGDIIFVRSSEVISEVGLCKGYVDKKNYSLYSGFTIRGNQSIYHPIVLQNIINIKARREIEKQAGGSTRYNVSQSILKKIRIQLPSLPEQEKIGKFFSLLDQRIEKQERKVALLEERKKGWMQKLFNQEIRFKDENGNDYPDWEEKKLGEIVDKQLKGKKSTESDKGNILLTTDYLDNGILSYVSEQNNVTLSDLLILWDGSQAGKVYIGHEGVLGSTFMKLELCNLVSENYTYQFLIFRKKQIQEKWRTGSGIPHVSKDFISSFVISLPTLPEQEKIANFLSAQDELIEKEKEKLKLMKQEKQGFMQRMFI